MDANLGFLLALVAGIMTGSFSLPMKKTMKWAWENTWLVWAFVALLIAPWAIGFSTAGNLMTIYSQVAPKSLMLIFLFGVGWGLGSVTFGQSISIIGMSLAFSICIGIVIVLGAILPLFRNPSIFCTLQGKTLVGGIVIMITGIVICALAGRMKERRIAIANADDIQAKQTYGYFIKGLVLAILGGIFSSMLNIAFAFGDGIKEAAMARNASEAGAADALWAFTLLGGLLVNLIYCGVLLTRNRTWPNYSKPATSSHWFLAALMGIIWVSSIFIYGRAAIMMGSLGKSAGWAIYMGFCILISNVWGIATGEWKQGRGKPLRTMLLGLVVLLGAIIFIGWANSLEP
ncbi:MAG: hypothetical protein JW709_13280 [Sedimentisphaerales bacterium]|nr:hypothetical protein [Sedimentisphaerales bacterium]